MSFYARAAHVCGPDAVGEEGKPCAHLATLPFELPVGFLEILFDVKRFLVANRLTILDFGEVTGLIGLQLLHLAIIRKRAGVDQQQQHEQQHNRFAKLDNFTAVRSASSEMLYASSSFRRCLAFERSSVTTSIFLLLSASKKDVVVFSDHIIFVSFWSPIALD